ncbi:MAG: YdbL family protein [Sphingomicrobium sp.]
MIRFGILALGAITLGSVASAQTAAVDLARAEGVVGERFDGYMGFASAPSAAVRSEVAKLNIRRRAIYSRFATSRGVSPQEVGITAGCQLLARIDVGQSYMLADGRWQRRAPTQAAPVPEYCT